MADKRISGLPGAERITADDLLLIVDDPLGTPTNKRVTVDRFFSNVTPKVVFSNTTAAFQADNAAVSFSGGVGIEKNLIVAGDLEIKGNVKQTQAVTIQAFSSNLVPFTHLVHDIGNNTTTWKNLHVRFIQGDTSGDLTLTANAVISSDTLTFYNDTITFNDTGSSIINVNPVVEFNSNVDVDSGVDRVRIQSNDFDVSSNTDFTGDRVTFDSNINLQDNVHHTGGEILADGNDFKSNANAIFYGNTTIGLKSTQGNPKGTTTSNLTVGVTNAYFDANITHFGTKAHFKSNVEANSILVRINSANTYLESNTNIVHRPDSVFSKFTVNSNFTEIESANLFVTGDNTHISSNASFGANVNLFSTLDSTSNTSGSLVVRGGVGITKSVTIGTNIQLHGNLHSNTNITANGLMEIDGNVTFNDNLQVYGDIHANGSITSDGGILRLGNNVVRGVRTLTNITTGANHPAGEYTNVDLTGGTGSGAQATVVIASDGTIESVTITTEGTGYTVGDTLTINESAIGNVGSPATNETVDIEFLTQDKITIQSVLASNLTPHLNNFSNLGNTSNYFANAYIYNLIVDENVAISDSLSVVSNDGNTYFATGNSYISSNTTIEGTNTVITSNVSISGTNVSITGGNTYFNSNLAAKGTNTVFTSNVSISGANVYITGDNTYFTSNLTAEGTNTVITSNVSVSGANVYITGDNTYFTSNLTAEGTNTVFTSNVSVSGANVYITGENTYFTSNVTIEGTVSNFTSNTIVGGTNTDISSNVTLTGANTNISSANVILTGDGVTIAGTDLNVSSNIALTDANLRITSTEDSVVSNTEGALTVAGGVGILKSVTIGENLNVHGNIHANGNITADGSLNLGDENTDNIVFNADVNSNIIPNIDGDYSLGNNTHRYGYGYIDEVEVTANLNIGDSISAVGSNVYFSVSNTFITDGNTTITGNTSFGANVDITDSISAVGSNAYFSVSNAFITSGNTTITGNTSFGANVDITDSISAIGSNVYFSVSNTFITDGNTTITGNTSFGANVDITDSISAVGSNVYFSVTNTFITSGNTTITGNTSLEANVAIAGQAEIVGPVSISGTDDSVVSNTDGSLTTAGGVGILKSVTIGENLNVHGNIHANGNITADGSLTLGDADTDSVSFGADLASNIIPDTDSAVDLGNTTNRFANAYIDDVEVTGNVNVSDSLSVSGTNAYMTVSNAFITGGNTTITGNVTLSGNATFTGTKQNVTSNVAISGTIDLSKRTIDSGSADKDIIHENSLISFGGVGLVVTDALNADDGVLLLQTGDVLETEISTRARLESNTSGTTISGKNIGVGHSIDYSVGEGRNVIIMEKGVEPTFPVDGLGNKILPNTQAYLYSIVDKDGGSNKVHLYTMDAGGSETRLGSHNDSGEWEYFSRNIHTGKIVRINMERMIRKLEEITGETFIEER